jgi:hypothetical protein
MSALIIWLHIAIAYIRRREARKIVYNYVMQNNIYYKRLNVDRHIMISIRNGSLVGYRIYNKEFNVQTGQIPYMKVNAFEYWFTIFTQYGWFDDDCRADTVAIGYGKDILAGKHFTWFPKWLLKLIQKEQDLIDKQIDGNAFDMGMTRPAFYAPILSTLWMIRNTAYNFNYVFEDIDTNSKDFWYVDFKKIGWHFGFLPKDSQRPGRMVWFTEDYNRR